MKLTPDPGNLDPMRAGQLIPRRQLVEPRDLERLHAEGFEVHDVDAATGRAEHQREVERALGGEVIDVRPGRSPWGTEA